MVRTKVVAASALLLVALAVAAPGPGAQQPAPPSAMGTVVVVHGVEGFAADIYLDGASTPALPGFEFRRVTDPVGMPVGTHRADLRRAGEPPTATPTLSGSFEVRPNERITIAALLDPSGRPTWLAFPNDAAVSDPARAELRFRHFAAAGPVNVALNDRAARSGVPNMATATQVPPVVLDPGRHRVAVTDASTGATVAPAQEVDLAAGSTANVYLTGRAPGPLALLQQAPTTPAVGVLNAQVPSAVVGGDSGLADPTFRTTDGGTSAVARTLVLGPGAAAVAALAGWSWTQRRRLRQG
jgi:hypothetical protein